MNPPRHHVGILLGLALAPLTPSAGRAQGFAVNEWDACSMGRGGATVARACAGGPALWFNPAGIGGATRSHLTAGVLAIRPSGSFTDDRTGERTDLHEVLRILPYGYFTHSLTEGLTAGLGVTIPYGLETEWPTTFEGRFVGYHTSLLAVYVQPTIGYDLFDLARVGVGVDLVFANVELSQRADLAAMELFPGVTFGNLGIPPNTDVADLGLAASGTGIGFNVGAQLTVWETLTIGLSYLHRVRVRFDGEARFRQVATGLVLPDGNPITGTVTPVDDVLAPAFDGTGALADGGAGTALTFPSQLRAGVAWAATPALSLFGEYHRQGWSRFDRIVIDFARDATPDRTLFQNFRDVHGVRLGAEYVLTPATAVRAGFIWHAAAAPDETVTPLLAEAARTVATGGLSVAVTERLRSHLALELVRQANRRGRLLEPATGVGGATLNVGVYRLTGILVGTSVTYAF